MQDTHVYEVTGGEVLFRRSGNGSRHIERCKVIRTRVANAEQENERWRVMISVLVTGYDNLYFSRWFRDWTDDDRMDREDFQSGRPIDVAVPYESFDHMLATGTPPAGSFGATTNLLSRPSDHRFLRHERSFHPVVAGVLIDGRWEEPLH